MKKKEKIIRQGVGIDISMETFDACIIQLQEDFDTCVVSTKKFKNDQTGFEQFYKWVSKFKTGRYVHWLYNGSYRSLL